jgi:hypothetical protein
MSRPRPAFMLLLSDGMASIDFDFQRYIERRKGAREAQQREGAAYAYAGDLRLLRALDRLRPVKLALEATVRLWRSAARAELLAGAVKVSPRDQGRVHTLVERCAERLHVPMPTTYVAVGDRTRWARTLGTEDEFYVVLSGALVSDLTDAELTDAIGRECGRIQNLHVLPGTALFHLEHFAARYVRWIVAPALSALKAWARRAEVTCDRAGLLCTRDLDVSAAALRKVEAAPERIEALAAFAESEYFKAILGQPGGNTPEACDARVAEILKGRGGGGGADDDSSAPPDGGADGAGE